MRVVIAQGDITTYAVDAIVNAANSSLMGGGGVDGAIHRAGGPEILAECEQVRDRSYPQGLPVGDAVATTAGRLPARWVIHTVGPIWSPAVDQSEALASCYRRSLEVADSLGARTIATPLISAGVYGYPKRPAALIALRALRSTPTHVEEATLVLFDRQTLNIALAMQDSDTEQP